MARTSVELVEHQVNHNASYRYVNPHRERPARDSHVLIELRPEAADCGEECERHDDGRQDDVGNQDAKVDDSNRTLPRKRTRARMEVVGHVAAEEERRRRQRAEHAPLMLTLTPSLDEQIP